MRILLPVLFCLSVASHVLYYFGIWADEAYIAYRWAFGAFHLLGGLWLYTEGTLRESPLRPFVYSGIGFFWLGQLFIIQHWPAGRLILLIGGITILVGYGIHFLRKRRKRYLDWLKLSWVILLLVLLSVGALYNREDRLWIGWAFNINALILICCFYLETFRKDASGRFELSEDGQAVFDYKEK